LVIFHNRLSGLASGLDDLESWETLNSEATTKCFICIIVAVYGGYFCETCEVFGSFFVCGLQVFAVSAPGSVELDDLRRSARTGRGEADKLKLTEV
jgi:hypothetical protein